MNKKKFILLALLLLCAYFYELFGGMPATVPFAPQPVKADTSLLLAPLDSRPPCSAMVRKLGALASINVITPPQELLDNYNTPADKEKLFAWLKNEMPQHPAAILSADLLVHGSLLGSRVPLGTINDEEKFLTFVQLVSMASDALCNIKGYGRNIRRSLLYQAAAGDRCTHTG